MAKATALAAANIAFVKYWGARDLESVLPWNPSVSMTLTACRTCTTVEAVAGQGGSDEVLAADGQGHLAGADEPFRRRVVGHLDRIRASTGSSVAFRVATHNSFPSDAGIASSASGFAALAVASTAALGLDVGPGELSSLARLSGSGSAARSVFGGFVIWPQTDQEDDLSAAPLAPWDHWPLVDVIAVVDTAPKEVSSRDGHRRATTSPFFARRQEILPQRTNSVIQAIHSRDLGTLGPLLEEEALELHSVALTSRPPILYWKPGTIAVMEAVWRWRQGGVQAYWTMDAGPNVHVIAEARDEAEIARRLEGLPGVTSVIRDRVGSGPALTSNHLF